MLKKLFLLCIFSSVGALCMAQEILFLTPRDSTFCQQWLSKVHKSKRLEKKLTNILDINCNDSIDYDEILLCYYGRTTMELTDNLNYKAELTLMRQAASTYYAIFNPWARQRAIIIAKRGAKRVIQERETLGIPVTVPSEQ